MIFSTTVKWLKSKGKLTVQVKDKEVKEFLDEILPKLGLEYAISQKLDLHPRKKDDPINQHHW